jgi:hypothetical protein
MRNAETRPNQPLSVEESFAGLGIKLESVSEEQLKAAKWAISIGDIQCIGKEVVMSDQSSTQKPIDNSPYSLDRSVYKQASWLVDLVLCSGKSDEFKKLFETVFNWIQEDLGPRLDFLKNITEELKGKKEEPNMGKKSKILSDRERFDLGYYTK